MKIVVLDGYALNPGDLSWDPFHELGEFVLYERTKPEDVIERIGDADAILINKIDITRDILVHCPNLKYIGVQATGYNAVDVVAAKELGVTVTNIPAYSTNAVAQFVFALLLEITHNVAYHSQQVQKGKWSEVEDFCFWDTPLMELSEKTMGIIGYGRIGQKTAEIAKAFGMNVIANSRSKESGETDNIATFVSFHELLQQADVISIHCPLTVQTSNMINKETISMMKPHAILINTARGAIINEPDLIEALNNKRIFAAGLDVAVHEPLLPNSPLQHTKNLFITPHIAWAPFETRTRLMSLVHSNLKNFLDGTPINVVS